MWHKAVWMKYAMKLEFTRDDFLVLFANHYISRGA